MFDIFLRVLENVLMALYQYFWFSLLTSFLGMYVYIFAYKKLETGNGIKSSLHTWFVLFRDDIEFRKVFFFLFYLMMILFRTLLNRKPWLSPLANVLGNWWIYEFDYSTEQYVLSTECIENLILFVPYATILLCLKTDNGRWKTLTIYYRAGVWSFIFSVIIEFLQLFMHLGTFQLSDVFYNTLGGLIGALCYQIYFEIKNITIKLRGIGKR